MAPTLVLQQRNEPDNDALQMKAVNGALFARCLAEYPFYFTDYRDGSLLMTYETLSRRLQVSGGLGEGLVIVDHATNTYSGLIGSFGPASIFIRGGMTGGDAGSVDLIADDRVRMQVTSGRMELESDTAATGGKSRIFASEIGSANPHYVQIDNGDREQVGLRVAGMAGQQSDVLQVGVGADAFTKLAAVLPTGGAFLSDSTTQPAAPASGGVLFVEGGALKYRGSGGTITEVAPA